MNKDVIYIDIEDDITAVIGKIKASKEKIVALVPPKRTGILQSAVNLRLLARMAETSNKKLVIITNNKALIALSAATMIPVAKNLQSKPELAAVEEPELEDVDDDIIEGSKLPIGELVKTSDTKPDDTVEDVVETINIEEMDSSDSKKSKDNDGPKTKSSGVKVPDFQSFRKKLFIGGALFIGLTVFLIWAIVYAPAAKIIVTTKTSAAPISATVKLGGTEATSIEKNIIRTVSKQTKKDLSIEFTATGTKDKGTKATGTISLSLETMPTDESIIKAGKQVTFGDKTYIIQNDITISKQADGTGDGSGTVTASANGESYNVLPGNACAVTSSPSVICGSTLGIGGGTTKTVSIVTAADVLKAKQVIVDMPTETVKQQLIKQFTNGEKVIDDSFTVDRADAVSVPDVGGEVTEGTKARLTSATTYTITAIAKSELDTFLRASVAKQITNPKIQRVFDDGIKTVVLSGFTKGDQVSTVNIAATGKIGPSIDEAYVKTNSVGKEFGDIQAGLGAVDGVSDVEVQFSYFWVSKVPTDKSKVSVEFISEK